MELSREKQTAGNFYAPGFASVNTTFAPAGSWPVANLYNPDPNVTGYNRISNGTGSFGKTEQDYMLTSFMLGGLTATRVGNTNTYRGTVPALMPHWSVIAPATPSSMPCTRFWPVW